MKYKLHWSIEYCGNTDIEAQDKEKAIEIFKQMKITDVVGTDDNIAFVTHLRKIEDEEQ